MCHVTHKKIRLKGREGVQLEGRILKPRSKEWLSVTKIGQDPILIHQHTLIFHNWQPAWNSCSTKSDISYGSCLWPISKTYLNISIYFQKVKAGSSCPFLAWSTWEESLRWSSSLRQQLLCQQRVLAQCLLSSFDLGKWLRLEPRKLYVSRPSLERWKSHMWVSCRLCFGMPASGPQFKGV